MWIFSKRGFYSIVEDKLLPNKWQVRARTRVDLENLINANNLQVKLIETPHADYRFRIVVDATQFVSIMSGFAKDVTYTNFKDAVKHVKGQQDKLDILHQIWVLMWKLQAKLHPYKFKGKRKANKYVGDSGKEHYSVF